MAGKPVRKPFLLRMDDVTEQALTHIREGALPPDADPDDLPSVVSVICACIREVSGGTPVQIGRVRDAAVLHSSFAHPSKKTGKITK